MKRNLYTWKETYIHEKILMHMKRDLRTWLETHVRKSPHSTNLLPAFFGLFLFLNSVADKLTIVYQHWRWCCSVLQCVAVLLHLASQITIEPTFENFQKLALWSNIYIYILVGSVRILKSRLYFYKSALWVSQKSALYV